MAEQNLPGAYENPYKFNAKELDNETGLYYYGARYYNPRISVWYGVDPLAVYNPVMETEFYGDGQHNCGVFFWGNLNPYIYTYQNPIKYIDPNGKQTKGSQETGVLHYLGKILNDINPFNMASQRMAGESERDQKRRILSSTRRNIKSIGEEVLGEKIMSFAANSPSQKLLKVADVIPRHWLCNRDYRLCFNYLCSWC